MRRINIYISDKQLSFLQSFSDITVSEHIRTAISLYIKEIQKGQVSNSPSKYGKSSNKNKS